MMGFCMVLVTVLSTLFLSRAATASTAGFIKSPLSEVKLLGDDVELHCEVIGKPIPEAQWWFERDESVDTFMQLWDGAWQDRIRINATYRHHATSTLSVFDLTTSDSGTYECRASNDPDRNDLKKSPRIKWIRSQANIIVIGRPEIIADVEMKNVNEAVLFCNLTNPPSEIKEVLWKKGEEVVFTHKEPPFISVTYTISKVDYHSAGEYVCLFETTPPVNATISVKAAPHVTAYKASENGNEGEKVVLICKSSSYPSVMWSWYKSGENVEINATDDKYKILSVPEKTELHIQNLHIKNDQDSYICEGSNDISAANATIVLRVRSRLAALWPFLGIVAEVIVLVTVIFIYEKRRKPDEVLDDDDAGATPLKSNAATNHKDENVRQRNSN